MYIPYHITQGTGLCGGWKLPKDPHQNRNKRKFSRFVHEGYFLSTPFLWVELTSWLTLFRLSSRKFLVMGSFMLDCGCDGRVILRDDALQIGSKKAYPLSGSSVQWGWLQGLCYSDLAFPKGFSLWYRRLAGGVRQLAVRHRRRLRLRGWFPSPLPLSLSTPKNALTIFGRRWIW